ncbi:hypothetical protein MWU77_11425 [Rhodococcus sp. F64268]|uniref:hypothetical protein n=1 Tax=Rhodococcus sp. F64268 TaxID=2926402 RepID=UPI001FF4F118|nr:hypothetical protein [Rhodococcus sp. F64268]MCK0091393.1 hypothetical protein [Rhodococcus sp. F64268]
MSILVLASCSQKAPEKPTAMVTPSQNQSPAQIRNATFTWSAEPGIDLGDYRGLLIRAAYESMIIAHYGGMDATYPGFTEALDPKYGSQINTRWDQSLAGTMRSHILQITETDLGFKATVCSQPSQFAIREADGTYRITNVSGSEEYVQFDHIAYSSDNPRLDPEDFWSTVHNTGPFPEPPGLPVSENQWSAPTEDLFSDTGYTITFGADLGETMHRCQDWGRSIEPDVPAEGSETIRSPIPPRTLPAYPGW